MFKGLLNFSRSFSKTCIPKTAERHRIWNIEKKPVFNKEERKFPVYPYSKIYNKSSERALFDGSTVGVGYEITEMNRRSKRRFRINKHKTSLWSEALHCKIITIVNPKLLRTLDKEGGLDNYLCSDKPARIKVIGPKGWKLRYMIMKAKEERKILETQALKDGIKLAPLSGQKPRKSILFKNL